MACFIRFSYQNDLGKQVKHSGFFNNRKHFNEILDRYNLDLQSIHNVTADGKVIVISQLLKVLKS